MISFQVQKSLIWGSFSLFLFLFLPLQSLIFPAPHFSLWPHPDYEQHWLWNWLESMCIWWLGGGFSTFQLRVEAFGGLGSQYCSHSTALVFGSGWCSSLYRHILREESLRLLKRWLLVMSSVQLRLIIHCASGYKILKSHITPICSFT